MTAAQPRRCGSVHACKVPPADLSPLRPLSTLSAIHVTGAHIAARATGATQAKHLWHALPMAATVVTNSGWVQGRGAQ